MPTRGLTPIVFVLMNNGVLTHANRIIVTLLWENITSIVSLAMHRLTTRRVPVQRAVERDENPTRESPRRENSKLP